MKHWYQKHRLIFRFSFEWIISIVIFLLFLLLIFPSLFQRAPFYSFFAYRFGLPYQFEISGNVEILKETTQSSGALTKAQTESMNDSSDEEIDYDEYTIHVGSSVATIDAEGAFDVRFLSGSKNHILLVITDEDGDICYSQELTYGEDDKKVITIKMRADNEK